MLQNQGKKRDGKEMLVKPDVLLFKKNKAPVRCICPRCGITHLLNFFWSGKGTPRKFCHRCREAVASIDEQFVYETTPDVFRVHKGISSSQPVEE